MRSKIAVAISRYLQTGWGHGMSGAMYVRVSQLIKMIPVSKASIWRKVKDGTFPKPVKLGDRITAWRTEDVVSWLASRHEEETK